MVYALITLGTFLLMEGITWMTHKYVMHGFLWYLHEDHHQPKYDGPFEKNDAFALIFAVPSSLCMVFGTLPTINWLFFVGIGILLYGVAYFLIHDVLIHQRFKWLKNSDNSYFRAIRKAHKVHHKNQEKEESECFGMLVVPFKYFLEQRKAKSLQTN